MKELNVIGIKFERNSTDFTITLGDDYYEYLTNEEAKQLFTFLDSNIEWRTEEEIEQEKADAKYDEHLDHLDKVRNERACSRIPDNIFRDND